MPKTRGDRTVSLEEWVNCPIAWCKTKILIRGKSTNELFEALRNHLFSHSVRDLETLFEGWLIEYLKKEVEKRR